MGGSMLTSDRVFSHNGGTSPAPLRAAITIVATLGAGVLALFFVMLPCAAWIEAGVNQAQGGTEFAADVVRDLAFAAVTPLVFGLVLRRRRRRAFGWLASFRAAAGYTSLIGFPLLVMRILAAAPFF